jgi:hypothetical protein
MGFAHGLHIESGHDIPQMLSSPKMDAFYSGVLAACAKTGQAPGQMPVKAGVFCLGRERATKLAGQGFDYVGFDTDLNALIGYAQGVIEALK